MKKSKFALALLVGFFAVGAAQAANVGISADVGTLGAGLHLTVPVAKQLNARIGFNAMDYNYSSETSDVDYDLKLKLQTFDALLDWYPTGSAFRVTGGLVYNGNSINATARPSGEGTYTLNGNTYTTADAGSIKGKIDFRSVAPYVGIGWGNAIGHSKGWGFTSDLGVMVQGSPRTSLSSVGCAGSAAACDALASDVRAENIQLADKADNFSVYPVVRIGVSYKF